MFAAFWNTLKIKELRNRLLFTAGIIILIRVAANIPCPGIDPRALSMYFESHFGNTASSGGLLGMVDLFSGGALLKFALATLGIMPYITSSIVMQLLTPVLPSLEKMSREGDSGRQKINQYTRYLTVLICLVQGTVAAMAMLNPGPARTACPCKRGNINCHESVNIYFHDSSCFNCLYYGFHVVGRTGYRTWNRQRRVNNHYD